MELPEKIVKYGRRYKLIKQYEHFGLYEEKNTKFKECFNEFDLDIKQENPIPQSYLNKIPII